jgi:TolB protein
MSRARILRRALVVAASALAAAFAGFWLYVGVKLYQEHREEAAYAAAVAADPRLAAPLASTSGRIAFVGRRDDTENLYVVDANGAGLVQVTDHDAGTRVEEAPAWSPDGTRLALTLSKEGDPEIFVLHMGSRTLQRLTNDRAIDTEPAWSPDGTRIAFTSDRGGGPQIYEIGAQGGPARRITFDGPYNARPRYSPDGKSLAVVNGRDRQYRIGLVDLGNGQLDILSKSRLDESPSFAPNGGMIIYTAAVAGGTELAAVSVDGRVHQRLALQEGEVREPAWGPFLSAP